MSAESRARRSKSTGPAASGESGGGLEELSAAVESGAGLPEVARVAARLLGGSVALIDRSSAVLAVADASSDEENKLLSDAEGVERVELRVADAPVGELRYRPRGRRRPDPSLARVAATMIALEVERARAPEWASDRLAADFVRAVLGRDVTDRGDIVARAAELGCEVGAGAGVVIARARPQTAQAGEWRERVLTLALRGLRSASGGALAAELGGELSPPAGEVAQIAAILPSGDEAGLARAATGLERELDASLSGFQISVARSRWTSDPVDLYRAGREALLAVNVGEAEGHAVLAFEETGAYRLLLGAMSEDPGELEQFYEETVAPLAAYDEQYATELVATVEAYLDNDGNVSPTAQQLFTHRHTVRYRLERVRELCGHDLSSTEGRERLGLGLKAMRVLGIAPPRGPAFEPGTEAGQVRRKNED